MRRDAASAGADTERAARDEQRAGADVQDGEERDDADGERLHDRPRRHHGRRPPPGAPPPPRSSLLLEMHCAHSACVPLTYVEHRCTYTWLHPLAAVPADQQWS